MDEYQKQYREKNRELLRLKQKEFYAANRERIRENHRKYYAENRERIRKQQNESKRTDEAREKSRVRQNKYRQKNKKKADGITARWKKRNAHKSAVHSLVCWAIKAKVMHRKENCEECGIYCKTNAHHEDYSKPMEVQWLCRLCHGKKHRKY